jgi:CheY-like chemotaxis protein
MRRARGNDPRPLALVADDEPLIRQLLCAVLGKHDWRTLEASDGIAAFAASLDQKLDLLITDFEMPLITGLELANAVRQHAPDLPILMISGTPGVAEVAREFGYRFLPKPLDLHELIDAVGFLTLNRNHRPITAQVPAEFPTAAAGEAAVEGRR